MNGGEALSTPAQSPSALLIARVARVECARPPRPLARVLAPEQMARAQTTPCILRYIRYVPFCHGIALQLFRASWPAFRNPRRRSSLFSLCLSSSFPLCRCLWESLHPCAIKFEKSGSACITRLIIIAQLVIKLLIEATKTTREISYDVHLVYDMRGHITSYRFVYM